MEIRLTQWLVQDGARVKAGDLICILESDNTTQEIDAPEAGIVRQLKCEGDLIASPWDLPFRVDHE